MPRGPHLTRSIIQPARRAPNFGYLRHSLDQKSLRDSVQALCCI